MISTHTCNDYFAQISRRACVDNLKEYHGTFILATGVPGSVLLTNPTIWVKLGVQFSIDIADRTPFFGYGDGSIKTFCLSCTS